MTTEELPLSCLSHHSVALQREAVVPQNGAGRFFYLLPLVAPKKRRELGARVSTRMRGACFGRDHRGSRESGTY